MRKGKRVGAAGHDAAQLTGTETEWNDVRPMRCRMWRATVTLYKSPKGLLIGSSLGHYFGIPAEGFIRTQGRRTRLVQPGLVDHVDVVGGKAAPGERRGERGGGGRKMEIKQWLNKHKVLISLRAQAAEEQNKYCNSVVLRWAASDRVKREPAALISQHRSKQEQR